MNESPVSVPLARKTRNRLAHTERTELHSQARRYDGMPQLLDIMPNVGYQRTSLATLAASEAITIPHEWPSGTSQFRSIRLQLTRPDHITTKPASSSFVRRIPDTADFSPQTRPSVPLPPDAAHKPCHLGLGGACITGPPTLPRLHPLSLSPIQIPDHKPFHAALPSSAF